MKRRKSIKPIPGMQIISKFFKAQTNQGSTAVPVVNGSQDLSEDDGPPNSQCSASSSHSSTSRHLSGEALASSSSPRLPGQSASTGVTKSNEPSSPHTPPREPSSLSKQTTTGQQSCLPGSPSSGGQASSGVQSSATPLHENATKEQFSTPTKSDVGAGKAHLDTSPLHLSKNKIECARRTFMQSPILKALSKKDNAEDEMDQSEIVESESGSGKEHLPQSSPAVASTTPDRLKKFSCSVSLIRLDVPTGKAVVADNQQKQQMGSSSVNEQATGQSSEAVSDLDIDDSDDEDLGDAPLWLRNIEQASKMPIPDTPQKIGRSQELYSKRLEDSPVIYQSTGGKMAKFSLDKLLAERKENEEEQKEYEKMQAELKEGLRQGGFVSMLDACDSQEEGLLPEHKLRLQQYKVADSVIMDTHPGENIFSSENFCQLFSENLTPQACGFAPGNSYIDTFLAAIQPNQYLDFLAADVLHMCFEAVSCKDAVLRWLFFIMSIHSSHLIINGCKKVIFEVIHNQKNSPEQLKTWTLPVADLTSVFVNYGANVKMLLPINEVDSEKISNGLMRSGNGNVPPPLGRYNRENMRLVIQCLAIILQARPNYTRHELQTILIIVCRASLDSSLNNYMLTYELSVCLASILQCFTEEDWEQQALDVCYALSVLTEHHHNKLYLAQLLPPGPRGNYIQRRLCFLMNQQLLFEDSQTGTEKDQLSDFKIRDLFILLPPIRQLSASDMYTLSSVIGLLDMCVGNKVIKSSEKDDLRILTDQLRKIAGEVRDKVTHLDKTRVKDMMVRASSKWALILQSMGSKQKSLFAWAKSQSPLKLTIEKVETQESEHSSEDEMEHSESEPKDAVSENVQKNKTVSENVQTKKTENQVQECSDSTVRTLEPVGSAMVRADTNEVNRENIEDSSE